MLAHIAGIPVEETALSLGPIAAATGGIAGLKLRERAARRRLRRNAWSFVPRPGGQPSTRSDGEGRRAA
ncbi:MAG TPA: hypothetical protein VHA54_04390 [Solirubrobacterales bacterium]|nr:hypothetical protein [Solirubrobacterales bacterium]